MKKQPTKPTKIKVEFIILIAINQAGDYCANVINDLTETIQTNLRNDSGDLIHFEAEAYHLRGFCEENNFDYFIIERNEFVELKNSAGYYKGN